jgi:hypothetical protein
METSQLNWPSQRNKRRWAVVWFLFLLILLALTSCSVQPRYHNKGFNITLGRNIQSISSIPGTKQAHTNKSFKNSSHQATKIYSTSAYPNDTTIFDVYGMHIGDSLIDAGQDQKWVRHNWLPDNITKPLSTMTIVGKGFLMHGKLVAANENGIFIYNPHEPLFWVSKLPYGKGQTAIRENIVYMPYTKIEKIRKGGTVSSKIEQILDQFFMVIFWSASAIFTILGIASSDQMFYSTSTLDIIMIIAAIIALIAALIATLALSIVLFPIIFLLQLSASILPGRYWLIGKKPARGRAFYKFMKRRHRRYRLYREDV